MDLQPQYSGGEDGDGIVLRLIFDDNIRQNGQLHRFPIVERVHEIGISGTYHPRYGYENGISGPYRLRRGYENGISWTYRWANVPENGKTGTFRLPSVPENGKTGTFKFPRWSFGGEEGADFSVGLAVLDDGVAVVATLIATLASIPNWFGIPYS